MLDLAVAHRDGLILGGPGQRVGDTKEGLDVISCDKRRSSAKRGPSAPSPRKDVGKSHILVNGFSAVVGVKHRRLRIDFLPPRSSSLLPLLRGEEEGEAMVLEADEEEVRKPRVLCLNLKERAHPNQTFRNPNQTFRNPNQTFRNPNQTFRNPNQTFRNG